MCDFLSPAPRKAWVGDKGRQGLGGVGEGLGWIRGIPEFATLVRDGAL